MTPRLRKPVERPAKRRARVGSLASLPLFFPLKARKVVLAGGSDAAAWKAELLAAAGAEVHIYAPVLSSAFEALLAGEGLAGEQAQNGYQDRDNAPDQDQDGGQSSGQSGAETGRFHHHARPWGTDSFAGAALAIGDAQSEGEAQAFFCASRSAGVPVNLIDRPQFCDFQFGSLVNRSPVVIGISTSGVAPILAQAIRRRIETLLPPALTGWAQLAGNLRAKVLETLSAGAERRRFWERFTDLAFSTRPAPDLAGAGGLEDLLREAQDAPAGRVTLVGAGPGDAEHLTLKAMRALQSADVILFDDLVDDSVLELARREARRLLVGKRGGRDSCRQEEINALMVRLARRGKHVVRLKSGDPAIFGRAGEELRELAEAGIPATIVPGITAASAMAAELGVSLTHRDHAQSVRFVTGHAKNGQLPETVDWQGLADPATTTVFYMGGRMAGQISARLIERGCAPDTPARLMTSISRPAAATWHGPLSALAGGVASLTDGGPILIGIGAVFAATETEAEAEKDKQAEQGSSDLPRGGREHRLDAVRGRAV